MDHPSVQEIAARTCDDHLTTCESCRRLAAMIGRELPPKLEPPLAAGALEIHRVDERHYTDWAPLAAARGGMGQIARARDRRLGRYVAIKQLRKDAEGLARDALVERLEREARLTARLQHPSIVGVYEAGRFGDGEPFYAMPLLRGAPLSAEIGRRTTIAERLALLPNLIAVAEAIAYAHDEGIVHRDLKPDNILIGSFGETVVIDWGLAKDLRAAEDDGVVRAPRPAPPGLTELGVGTAYYMPPEQARGEDPDERADVYALGATLYHTIAGRPPYAGEGATRARRALVDERPPPPLSEIAPGVPPELADIVARAMAHDKASRFAGAREIADELRRFQTGQLLTSRRYTPGELLRHFARRYRTPLRIAAVAAGLLAAVVVIAFLRVARERDRAEAQGVRAERELRRAQGTIASRTALDPTHRLDAILLGLGAVAPDLAGGRPVISEAFQGLVDALTAGPPMVPLPHQGAIKGFALAGQHLLGVDDARALVVWDARLGDAIATHASALLQPEQPVVSPDGTRAVVCGFDKRGEVYELASGARRTFDAGSALAGCYFLPDGRLVTAADAVVIRDPATLAPVEEHRLPAAAHGMARGPGGAIAVVALGGWLWLSTPGGGAPALVATGLPLGPRMAFSVDGRQLFQAGADQVLRVFDVAAPTTPPQVLYRATEDVLVAAHPSRDGRWLALSVFDIEGTRRTIVFDLADRSRPPRVVAGMIATWLESPGWMLVDDTGPLAVVDAESGGTLARLDAHRREGAALALPEAVATASRDGAAFRWDLTGGREGGALWGHTAEIVAIAAGDEVIATASEDGSLRLWDAVDGHAVAVAGGARELVAIERLGAAIVAADLGGTVRVVDHRGAERARAELGSPIGALAVASDGGRVAIGTLDGRLELRDGALAAALPLSLPARAGAVTALAFSPDGARLASAHADGSTRVWDVARGRELAARADAEPLDAADDHEGHAALWFTPDGARLLAARPAGTTLDWRGDALAPDGALAGRGLALSSDGVGLAAALGDGTVLVHDLRGGDRGTPRRLAGSRSVALAAAFASDGALAVARLDGSIDVWDAADATAPRIRVAMPQLGPATAIAWSRGDVVVGYASGATRIYPVTPEAAVARACAVARRFGRERAAGRHCNGRTSRSRT